MPGTRGARPLVPLAVLLLLGAAAAFGSGSAPPVAPPVAPPAALPYAPAIAVIDLFGQDTRFEQQSVAGRSEVVADGAVRGDGWLRVSTDGDGRQVNVRARTSGPLDLRDAHLRLLLRVDDPDGLDQMLVYLSSDGFAGYESYRVVGGPEDGRAFVLGGEWSAGTGARGTPRARAGAGAARARVTDLQVSLVDRGRAPVEAHLDALEAIARPARGVVTLMFDDARDGVFRHARPILDRHGLRASVAAIVDLVDTPGFMSLTQLGTLERHAGWEVVAHHTTALPHDTGFAGLDDDGVAHELGGVRAWLLDHGFRRGADHLAYPYGVFDARTVELVRRTFASGRTIVRGLGLETLPPGDPYRIRAWSVTSGDAPEDLMAAIDRAARDRSWLVLVYHQVVDGPTAHATDVRASDLAAVAAHLASADVVVLTLSEALSAPR